MSEIKDNEHDLPFVIMKKKSDELATDLPKEILSGIYNIQKKHMYNRDRTIPLNEMQRFLESYIESSD